MHGYESKCLGKPGSYLGCGADAGIVLVQVRPGEDGHPAVFVLAVCPDHVDDLLAFMSGTWPHDEIRMMSLVELRPFLDSMTELLQEDSLRTVIVNA